MLLSSKVNLADFNVHIILIIEARICLSEERNIIINHEYSGIGLYINEIMLLIHIAEVSVKSKANSTVLNIQSERSRVCLC